MIVDESNYEILERAYNITGITNKIFWRDAENIDGRIDSDDVMLLMEQLISEYEHTKEELRDLESRDYSEDPDLHDKWEDQALEEGIL